MLNELAPTVDFEIDTFQTDALDGRFELIAGTLGDYKQLARHHYLKQNPVAVVAVRCIFYCELDRRTLAAVGVLSYCVPMLRVRAEHFGVAGSYAQRIAFANANLRTISRVVVHPQFRSIGLATRVAKSLIDACPTRHVESLARMGRFSSFLERAGMQCVRRGRGGEPAYFVYDKLASANGGSSTCENTPDKSE